MPRGQENVNSPEWLLRQRDTVAYCNLRACSLNKDKKGMRLALAEFSTNHARLCARRLVLRASEYAAALDRLLAVEALRAGFWLKMMHRVISLRNVEVQSYWEHIRKGYELIAEGETLSATDMDLLEGKCPRYSESDSSEIAALIEDGSLCPNAKPHWRAGLLGRLKTLPLMIRTLNTFFTDLKYMEDFVPCIYHVVDRTSAESCDSTLRDAYGKSTGFETARQVLWRFILQNYLELPQLPRRSSRTLLAKQRPGGPDEERLHALATLAHELGFESDKITRLRRISAEELIARHALLRARKPPVFRAEDSHFESIQDAMVEVCREVPEVPRTAQFGKLVSSIPQTRSYASGFPDMLSYEREKEHLSEWDASILQSPPPMGWRVTTLFRLQTLCHILFDVPTELAFEKNRARRESWETIRPEDSEGSAQLSESEEGGEAEDRSPAKMPSNRRHTSPDVVFVELVNSKWNILRQVHSPNKESVRRVAEELCASHCLAAVSPDGGIGFIAPEDCFHSAVASGINTVLAMAVGATEYDSDTISCYTKFLYQ
ncbi:hypothetical protein IF1G_11402 [Cordyceps javanica]|uniref:Uncharacterized protein n=1 Tax=Cordyceps javanica TaxID=43265 RepID=A0A545UKE9_9HYPO|nr:hypothetical protein IF1G_11402 [Cordyceps javanica]TQW01400.1 hypothetical protein IF2G_11080 [Cordyceps javanica]